MVWSRKPRSHKIWYTGAPLTVRPDEGRKNEKVAEKGTQRFEIAPCRTEIGACGPPRGGHKRRRRKRNLDVLGIGSAAPLLSARPRNDATRKQRDGLSGALPRR